MTTRVDDWAPCECYQAWESAREETALALEDWRLAPRGARREAFTVYRAAADREDAAASAWLRACEAYDAAQLVAAPCGSAASPSLLQTKEDR
jgi:hypothetical protein